MGPGHPVGDRGRYAVLHPESARYGDAGHRVVRDHETTHGIDVTEAEAGVLDSAGHRLGGQRQDAATPRRGWAKGVKPVPATAAIRPGPFTVPFTSGEDPWRSKARSTRDGP